MGIQLPKSYYQPYQQSASYTPYQDQPIEEKTDLEKSLEAFLESGRQNQNMKDSQSHQNFQIQEPYSISQVPQLSEEPTDLEKSMKFMIHPQYDYIQSQNEFLQSTDRLEATITYFVNTINNRYEQTLHTQFLTIPDSFNYIDRNQES